MNTSREWIQSYTGRKVEPLNLKPEMVCIEDIAHALSLKTRFTGHTKYHYSVAQHCALGADLLPRVWKLPFLLHEVSEVYLPDIASPIKKRVKWTDEAGNALSWAMLEDIHLKVCLEALGLSTLYDAVKSPVVLAMDISMLLAEKNQLLGESPEDWGIEGDPADLQISTWNPGYAEERFLMVYESMTKRGAS